MQTLPPVGDDAEFLEPLPQPKRQLSPLWYVLIMTLCISTIGLRFAYTNFLKSDKYFHACCTQSSPPSELQCQTWALTVTIPNARDSQYFVRVQSEKGTVNLNLEYVRSVGRADTYLALREPEKIGVRIYSSDSQPRSDIFYVDLESNVCTVGIEFF